jgi:outer membrane protein assembly factor BamE
MDIQQGNVVTQDMLAKLKPGMTPSQVRFILGTPLVVDAFHKDRWDYVYRLEKRGTLQEHRRIVVIFKDDRLDRIEGDVAPAQPGSATEGGVKIDKPSAAAGKPAADAQQAPPRKRPPDDDANAGTPKAATAGGAPPADAQTTVGANGAQPKEGKPKDEKPSGEQSGEDRGFFGRMLDKLGF